MPRQRLTIGTFGDITTRKTPTAKSTRVVAIPTFTADAVRRRLAKVGSMGLDDLLFQSRDGTH